MGSVQGPRTCMRDSIGNAICFARNIVGRGGYCKVGCKRKQSLEKAVYRQLAPFELMADTNAILSQ